MKSRRVTGGQGRSVYRHLYWILAVTLTIAACGASGSGGSGSAGGATNKAAVQDGVQKAETIVQRYKKRPTEIPVTVPIDKPIPNGKHIAFISCGSPECNQEGAIIRDATNLLGWTLDVIHTDGTVPTEKAAFRQVVRKKPDAVLYSAIEQSVVRSVMPNLKKNGTFVAACCVTTDAAKIIDYAIAVPKQTAAIGKVQAAWVTANSNGHGNAVYVNLPAFQVLKSALEKYKSSVKDFCPACSVDTLNIPITALGHDVPTRIVSYLRAHPDVNYVVLSTDSLAVGVPAALRAAGLNDVKIGGQGATATNLQYIASGSESFSVAFAYYEAMWAEVDAVARHEAGVAVPSPSEETYPIWLLTQQNAPRTDKLFPVVKNVEQKFKKLWGVS